MKALIEICIADDMISIVMWNNKDTPSSTLGTFVICEKICVFMSSVREVFNALYNERVLWMALSLVWTALAVTTSV